MSKEIVPANAALEQQLAGSSDCALGQLCLANLRGTAEAGQRYVCAVAGPQGGCGKTVTHTGERMGLLHPLFTDATPDSFAGCTVLGAIADAIEREA